MPNKRTIERFVLYNRLLKELDKKGYEFATSRDIADGLSRSPALVRKDLSHLGRKGRPGVGYSIRELINDMDLLLGLKRRWGVVLIGAGNLGRALCYYTGFKREGFEFRMIVDSDPKKIGKKWGDIVIRSPRNFQSAARKNDISIAIIAVPEQSAQQVAQMVVDAGIREILNFAPATLALSKNINVRYADLALELENLSYHLTSRVKTRVNKKIK